MIKKLIAGKVSISFWVAAPKASMTYCTTQGRFQFSFLCFCFFVSSFFCPPNWTLQIPWLASQPLWLASEPLWLAPRSSSWPLRPSSWPLNPPIGLSDPLTALLTIWCHRPYSWPLDPPIGLSKPLTALLTIYLASQTL